MDKAKKIAKSTLAIIIFSLLGRILGFFREILSAAIFGATHEMDAFIASQSITSIISVLLTASIAAAFIPSLQKAERELGNERKIYFTNNMFGIVTIFSIIAMVLGVVFAPQLTLLYTSHSTKLLDVYELVVYLTKIQMPVIFFSCIVGVMTGYLQYEGFFAITGGLNIPLNLTYIIYLKLFAHHVGIIGLTIASVLGVAVQILFLAPYMHKTKFKFRPVLDFKDEYVKESLILCLPILVSSAVADINSIVNKRIAMGLGEGAVSVLNWANKMNLMFLGVFVAAITTVVFPTMSKAFGSGDMIHGKRVMNAAVKVVLFLTVPATVGLLILGKPFVEIAFLRGKFTVQNAIDTTAALRCYSFALISISISNVLNRVYYSIKYTKAPFIIGIINVVINIVLNVLVAHKFGTSGLAASVSIATTIAVILSFVMLRKRIGSLGSYSYIRAIIKSLIAAGVMGTFTLVYYPIETILINHINSHIKLIQFMLLLIVIGIAAIIYGIMLYLLGVREVKDIIKLIKQKRMKKRMAIN